MKETLNIKDLIAEGIGQAKDLTLDLSIAVTDRKINISGTTFGIWSAPNDTDQILVRFNEQQANQIPFQRGQVLDTLFEKVYITVPAGLTGNMVIIYGTGGAQYFKMRTQGAGTSSGLLAVLQAIEAELQGDLADEGYGQTAVGVAAVNVIGANANRKGAIVQSDPANTQPIYLGFDNTVAANNCFAVLGAAASWSVDDYRGDIYAIAGGAGQNVNWGEY